MQISIFGIGYVGAVTAGCLTAQGHHVIAVDMNPGKVEMINRGLAPIVEPGLDQLIKEGVEARRLQATTDAKMAIENSVLSIICVGTPSLANGNLDLSHVAAVCEEIGQALKEKDKFHSVVLRSTMLP
ncbi:MAG TPA: GDP-mannose dehydrogenase, partial [Alphaproteobacteria bacterium]|nr:GDP-mannose dehydrogenase [Alphaproteobacteria bacterium]